MNSTFQLNRFLKLVKTETLINKSVLMKLLLGIIFFVFLKFLFEITLNFNPISIDIILFLSTGFMIIAPLFLYNNLYHKTKGVQYAMIPASQFEKFLSAIIQTNIIVPILLFSALTILLSLFKLHNNVRDIQDFYTHYFIGNSKGNSTIIGILWQFSTVVVFQSFIFLGVFWFKPNKILKIILANICIISFFLISVNIFMEFGLFNGLVSEYLKLIFIDKMRVDIPLKFIFEHKQIFNLFIPLILWTIAFLKFKKTQI
jgi:hypothetical protein